MKQTNRITLRQNTLLGFDAGQCRTKLENRVNKLKDRDPDKFTIVGFCAACDYRAPVKRIDEDMEIPTLIARLSCSHCGSDDCSIRIIYTAAGGIAYA